MIRRRLDSFIRKIIVVVVKQKVNRAVGRLRGLRFQVGAGCRCRCKFKCGVVRGAVIDEMQLAGTADLGWKGIATARQV